MKHITLLLGFILFLSSGIQAQVNNPIFNGGNADGAAVAHYVTPTNSAIFSGGTGDGHDKDSYLTPTNSSIFSGGTGDGHDKDNYVTPTNSPIFGGGSGDGHDKDAYVTPTNSGIFAGGLGDGFDSECNDPFLAPWEDPDLCPEDLNLDGTINIDDFLIFNSAYGSDCTDCRADINGDGTVDISDFLAFNSAYGSDCPTVIGLQAANNLGSGFQLSFALQHDLRGIDKDDIHPGIMEKIAGPVEAINFSLFPNPNSGREVELYLQRDLEDMAAMRIEVLDTRGREILNVSSSAIGTSQSEIIRFEQPLTKGLYFVHVLLDGKRAVKKLVVQ
jgi:hypothetical protein